MPGHEGLELNVRVFHSVFVFGRHVLDELGEVDFAAVIDIEGEPDILKKLDVDLEDTQGVGDFGTAAERVASVFVLLYQ